MDPLRLAPLCALALVLTIPQVAGAGDGVVEINQACVTNGCFAGDDPGFPIQITQPGSYRLTSNVTMSIFNSDQTVHLIELSANDVTLDLGGFALTCFRVLGGPNCTGGAGGGRGVVSFGIVGRAGNVVRNGSVRGMAGHGVEMTNGEVERIRALDNGLDGIQLSGGQVRDSYAVGNARNGIFASLGSVADGCFAEGNSVSDIVGARRDSVYTTSSLTNDLGGNLDLP